MVNPDFPNSEPTAPGGAANAGRGPREMGRRGGYPGRAPGEWRGFVAETAAYGRRVGRTPLLVLLGVVAALVVVAYLVGVRHGSPPPLELPSVAEGAPAPVATTEPSTVSVHLAGAVREPGLYEVASGWRVGDLIERAGGPTEGAQLDRVNLARRLRDEERVYVPFAGEEAPPVDSADDSGGGVGDPLGDGNDDSTGGGPINVNTASQRELDRLPGIGPALAQRIIDYRNANGPFASVDALQNVRGIGPATVAELRPYATT